MAPTPAPAPPCTSCGTDLPGRRTGGLCTRCYKILLATGERQRVVVRGIPGRRFMMKVDLDGPIPVHDPGLGACWLWCGSVAEENGYGLFRVSSDRVDYAHRWVYEHAVGPIPDGHHVDHLCHDWATCVEPCPHRACVNPTHLAAVVPAVNNARSGSPTAVNARKDFCDNGHPFDDANTYLHPARGTRHCRACQRDNAARYEGRRRMLVASAAKRRASRAPGAGQVTLFDVSR